MGNLWNGIVLIELFSLPPYKVNFFDIFYMTLLNMILFNCLLESYFGGFGQTADIHSRKTEKPTPLIAHFSGHRNMLYYSWWMVTIWLFHLTKIHKSAQK